MLPKSCSFSDKIMLKIKDMQYPIAPGTQRSVAGM
jgi:hypothetical protein